MGVNKNFVGVLLVILNSFSAAVFAAVPGILDTTFNSAGIQAGTESTTINSSTSNNDGQAVAIQADGNIVVVGVVNGSPVDFGVARFLANGGLDPAFNTSGAQPGTVQFSIVGSPDSQAQAVAIQADGKIVVAGFALIDSLSALATAQPTFAVARLNPDGTLDSEFNSGGTQTVSFGGGLSQAQAVAIQSDGKIVLAGIASVGGNDVFAVARLNTDGTIDLPFGGSDTGINSTTVGGMSTNGGAAVAIQADGKIVIAGFAGNGDLINQFGVARFNADGTLDTTAFNVLGTQPGTNAININGGASGKAYAVAIQADGKIVLAGESPVGFNETFAAARFNSDGTLDETFNAGSLTQPGTVTTTVQDSTSAIGTSVAIQENGKIIIAGQADVGGANHFAVARFLTNGTLDTTFNPDDLIQPGTNATLIDNTNEAAVGSSVALQSDGKIVIAGTVLFSGGSPADKFAVARFNGDAIVPVPPVVTTDPFALRLIQKYGSQPYTIRGSYNILIKLQVTFKSPVVLLNSTMTVPCNYLNGNSMGRSTLCRRRGRSSRR